MSGFKSPESFWIFFHSLKVWYSHEGLQSSLWKILVSTTIFNPIMEKRKKKFN